MGELSNLTVLIKEMLDDGHYSYETIAQVLDIPVSWVLEVEYMMDAVS